MTTQQPLATFSVTPEEIGLRLDHFLVRHFPEHSRSYLQRCVEAQWITMNGEPARVGVRLEGDETIDILGWLDETPEAIQAADIPLDILFEDNDLLVINKPAGPGDLRRTSGRRGCPPRHRPSTGQGYFRRDGHRQDTRRFRQTQG